MSKTPDDLRLMPHDLDAERALLGSMMLDDQGAVRSTCVGMVRREDFYSEDHRLIYDAVCRLTDLRRPIDALTVRTNLEEHSDLAAVGGSAYLGLILSSVPSYLHGEHYAQIVSGRSHARRLIPVLEEARHALLELKDPEGVRQAIIASVAEMRGRGGGSVRSYTMEEVMHEAFEGVCGDEKPGLRSCFGEVGKIVRRYERGGNYVVAARPSIGKSVFARQEAIGWGLDGHKGGIISIEETRRMIGEKSMSAHSGVDNWRIADGKAQIREGEWADLGNAVAKLANCKVWVVDAAQEVGDIVAAANRLKAEHDIEFLVIDHIHLVQPSGRGDGLNQQLTEISRAVKGLYKRLDVVGLTVCQLNRQVASRENKRPQLTDLRDSGSIEQDADCVLLLHREDYYHQGDATYSPDHTAEVFVAKQRGGRTGVAPLGWDGPHQRFTESGARPAPAGI